MKNEYNADKSSVMILHNIVFKGWFRRRQNRSRFSADLFFSIYSKHGLHISQRHNKNNIYKIYQDNKCVYIHFNSIGTVIKLVCVGVCVRVLKYIVVVSGGNNNRSSVQAVLSFK